MRNDLLSEESGRALNARTTVCLVLLAAVLSYQVWQARGWFQPRQEADPGTAGLAAASFALQAKILLGTLELWRTLAAVAPDSAAADTSRLEVARFARDWLNPSGDFPGGFSFKAERNHQNDDAGDWGRQSPIRSGRADGAGSGSARGTSGSGRSADLWRRQLILARHLNLAPEAAVLSRLLGADAGLDDPAVLARLGWFGRLRQADADDRSGRRPYFSSAARQEAIRQYQQVLAVSAALAVIFLGALAAAGMLAWRFLAGTITAAFRPAALPGYFLLEIFTGYAVGMTGLDLAGSAGLFDPVLTGAGRLAWNLAALSALGGTVLWPLAWGRRPAEIVQALGLRWPGLLGAAREAAVGTAAFLAALPFVAAAALASFWALRQLGFDTAQGVHPIIPILSRQHDPRVVLMVFALGTVVAPVLEETMFRGAAYAWLRRRLPAWGAALVSGFAFALVHPQGLAGLLPITTVGAGLALLREWRGGLLAGMAAHAAFNAFSFTLVMLLFSA